MEKTKKQKKINFMRILKRNWVCYLFILPMLIYVIIFNYIPMYGIQLAFKDYRVADGIWGSAWVGLKHFKTFFESYQFKDLLWNTLSLSLYSLIAGFPMPIHNLVSKFLLLAHHWDEYKVPPKMFHYSKFV